MILLIACVLGVIGAIIWNKVSDYAEMGPIVLGVVCGAVGLITGLVLLINPLEVRGDIKEFISVQTTVDTARNNGESIENAAIQLEVIEMNQWLADIQYENGLFFFGDFIPNEVDNLEPIR